MRITNSRLLLPFGVGGAVLIVVWTLWTPTRSKTSKPTVPSLQKRVVFVGDTSFGENYQAEIAHRGGEDILERRGYNDCLVHFADFLRAADVVVANLETALTNIPISPLAGAKSYVHWGHVQMAPRTLQQHNVTAVSLANNHTLDYGLTGLEQTRTALKAFSIEAFGAGPNEAQAGKPWVCDVNVAGQTQQLVVVAGFEYHEKYDKDYRFYAISDRGGTNAWTPERAAVQLRALRSAYPEAFVIAYPHFGRNYAWKNAAQTELAHALIDGGADLVLGHGAHMLQEIERYQGHWIIYSLGNFVFNSPGRYQKKGVDPLSLIAMLVFTPQAEGVHLALRLYPTFCDNLVTNYRSDFVTERQFRKARTLLLERNPAQSRLEQALQEERDGYGWYFELEI